MREIKFRGKKVNGGFVFGLLIPRQVLEDPDHLESLWIATGLENECYPIVRETVGQFTGIYDASTCPVFEGDILMSAIKDEMEPTGWLDVYNQVVFQNGSFGYLGETTGNFYPFREEEMEAFEVAGNIYENPDLLK